MSRPTSRLVGLCVRGSYFITTSLSQSVGRLAPCGCIAADAPIVSKTGPRVNGEGELPRTMRPTVQPVGISL